MDEMCATCPDDVDDHVDGEGPCQVSGCFCPAYEPQEGFDPELLRQRDTREEQLGR